MDARGALHRVDRAAGNYRRSLAECHFAAGRPETGDALYREWLEADPRWGWGWLGWAGAYGLFTRRPPDYARAEEILRQALEVEGFDPREAVLDHLAEVLTKTGCGGEARLVLRARRGRGQRLELSQAGAQEAPAASRAAAPPGAPSASRPRVSSISE